MATLVSFRVSPRQKCTDEGEVVGNGNGNSIGRRAIGDERTNEPSMAHSIERKSRQTDFIPLSLSLSLSPSRFFETNRCQNGGIIGLSVSAPS